MTEAAKIDQIGKILGVKLRQLGDRGDRHSLQQRLVLLPQLGERPDCVRQRLREETAAASVSAPSLENARLMGICSICMKRQLLLLDHVRNAGCCQVFFSAVFAESTRGCSGQGQVCS